MKQEFVNKQSFVLFVLTFVFGILLYNVIRFKGSDELCALLLVVFYAYYVRKTQDWRVSKGLLITFAIFLFYVCYSFYIHSNSLKAIIFDLIIQLKPYVSFFIIYHLAPTFSKSQKVLLKQICLIVWVLLLPVAVVALLVDERIFILLFEHPTNFALSITALALVYLFCSDYTLKDRLVFIVLLAAGLASGRAKFYGFFVMASFLVLYFNHMDRLKFDAKTIFVLICVFGGMFIVAKDKIDLYFVNAISGEERDLVARAVLYLTSFDIIKDFFPFGSGLASFGTHASGVFYSDIYSEYGINTVWGLTKEKPSFIADTYYPSLAQFGIVGIALYAFFWLYLLYKSYVFTKQTADIRCLVLSLLIAGYLLIENVAEAAFTSNKGFFMLLLLGFVLAKGKTKIVYNGDKI